MKSPREALQPELVPPPPPSPRRKRMSLVSIVSGILSFVIVLAVVGVIGWSFAVKRVTAPGPLAADKTVNIPKGDDVAQTLEDQGVIDNAQFMKLTLLAEGNKANVKAGEYLFKQNASLQDVIDTLVSGKQVLHSVTIPEGLTSLQTVERLRDNDILVGDIKNIPPEGSLMPDTYKFARGTTRDQLIKQMQLESRKVVADIWAHRDTDEPIRSPSEMVTLASIVEKETGKPDERPLVAGVFLNRLAKNIPLQSDPTIVYGLVGGKGTLGRGILKSEVEQKTPYNTYAIVGLPPGPIANPGRAALEAVANPTKTKDLYFVADGTGGHAFAETLDQHRLNVQKWRQIEKDAKDKLVPDADKTLAPGGAPGKPNQRTDLDDDPAAFGAVNTFAKAAPSPVTEPARPKSPFTFDLPDQTRSLVFKAPTMPDFGDDENRREADADLESAGLRGTEPGVVVALAIEALPALDAEPAAEDMASSDANLATFPVSASRQAQTRARAVALGLPTGTDRLDPAADEPVRTAMVSAPASPLPNGRVAIYDASEGTKLDPLLDKSFDLNSAKSVPNLKAMAPLGGVLGR